MAEYRDAAAGWEIFRDREGAVSKAQLNQALRAQGLNPIADRTYKHYGKLFGLGYEDYVSINRLDLRHSNDSVFDLADRSRLQDHEVASPGTLVVPRAASVDRFTGQIVRVSDGFVTLRLAPTDEAKRAANASTYNKGVLIFDQVGVERAVQIVEGTERNGMLDLVLSFRSLLNTDLLTPVTTFDVGSLTLRMNLGPETPFFDVLGVMHHAFDLAESMRGFSDQLMTATGRTGLDYSTPAPRIRHLEVTNPLELIITGAVLVTLGITTIINRVSNSVGNTADAVSKVQAIGMGRRDETRKQQLHDLQVRSLQLDNVKKAVEVVDLVERLRPAIEETAGREIGEISSATNARLSALKDQAIEAAAELALRSEIEFETDAQGD